MKKIIIYTIVLSCFLYSCDTFLDEDIRSSISVDKYYKNSKEVISAVNGVYAALNPASVDHIWLNELSTDDGALYDANNYIPPQDRVEFRNLMPSASMSWFQSVWTESYSVINRANSVLEYSKIENVKDTALFKRLNAEVRFLRAWHYFRLVQWYGGLPLMTKSAVSNENSTMFPSRSSISDVYDLILNDLKYAAKNLPYKYAVTTDKGRVTRGAAFTYLGKVYLTMYGYPLNAGTAYLDSSQVALDSVILNKTKYGYDCPTAGIIALKDIFDPEKRSTNSEVIFASSAVGDATLHSGMYSFFLKQSGNLHPSNEAWADVFEASDLRRNITFGKKKVGVVPDDLMDADPLIDTENSNIFIRKYIDTAKGLDYARNDYQFTRYSDVLLMHAEVLCYQNKLDLAVQDLIPIRTRANQLPALITYQSKEDLIEKIRLERRKELMFEGHRRNDLVRWGIYPQTMKVVLKQLNGVLFDDSHVDNTRCLFPLPAKELSINPNIRDNQNPGYN